MTAYLDQLAVSSRPGTVDAASLALRQFADHLTRTDPACTSVAAVERRHVESFKVALAARTGRRGTAVDHRRSATGSGCCAPSSSGSSTGTTPTPHDGSRCSPATCPKPTSRCRSSSTTPPPPSSWPPLAVEPNKRRRLIVELLARTGMRVGELGGLRDDAMYRLGDTWWLRIPVGKLHNDRTVPLHPMLVGLINDYRTWRGPTATGLLVERDDHQPMDPRTIYRHVKAVARRAGVGHVHPHALRHTLATQCINRGMSLEAIAALLGHRSPRMTLVYARISDTTVAEQYFTATRALEAGSDTAAHAPTTPCATPPQLHRRLLGNGHCTRPLELDCRFQTICEGCGFFQTGPEFVPILRRQRDDAAAHSDRARTDLYDDLIRRHRRRRHIFRPRLPFRQLYGSPRTMENLAAITTSHLQSAPTANKSSRTPSTLSAPCADSNGSATPAPPSTSSPASSPKPNIDYHAPSPTPRAGLQLGPDRRPPRRHPGHRLAALRRPTHHRTPLEPD